MHKVSSSIRLILCGHEPCVIVIARCLLRPCAQGPRRYSVECIHPYRRCVTQRIMIDKVFEIETAAIALRTCHCEEPGTLHTDFSCAYASVDHRWIFMVLERAGVPQTLQHFLRGIYADSAPCVEHSCVARGQFAMLRRVRQGCPASGYLFTVAFDPVFR